MMLSRAGLAEPTVGEDVICGDKIGVPCFDIRNILWVVLIIKISKYNI